MITSNYYACVALIENEFGVKKPNFLGRYFIPWNINDVIQETDGVEESIVVDNFTPIDGFDNIDCKMITSGYGHYLILDNNGDVYGFGNNSKNQIIFDESETNDIIGLNKLNHDQKYASIFACSNISIGIDYDGDLWIWGELRRYIHDIPLRLDVSEYIDPYDIQDIMINKFVICILSNNDELIILKYNENEDVQIELEEIDNIDNILSLSIDYKPTGRPNIYALSDKGFIYVISDFIKIRHSRKYIVLMSKNVFDGNIDGITDSAMLLWSNIHYSLGFDIDDVLSIHNSNDYVFILLKNGYLLGYDKNVKQTFNYKTSDGRLVTISAHSENTIKSANTFFTV